MKITFLGQAGLIFEQDGFTVMIAPYLSDSVEKLNPKNYRRVRADENFFKLEPNVMIFTHNHLDHYDPETAARFITADSKITVLSPHSVWNEVRKFGGDNNYILFNRHTSWTENGITFTAVKAEHSDPYAIGVIIEDREGRQYYITGDTLYNDEIFDDIKGDIHALFLPINGVGNNMNMIDAAKFAKCIDAKKTVPLHIGMFDTLTADDFLCDGKTSLKIYEEVIL